MGSLTDVPGLRVGHYTDAIAATGCTVVLCEDGAVAGVDVRGFAPGTRETDLLRPESTVGRVHAILLTGGSAFGLDAAGGVMRYLEGRGVGYEVGGVRVPIVPAAVLFDLLVGRSDVRPGAEAGMAACEAASSAPVAEGSVGAGTGATVGKLLGPRWSTKSGIGSWAADVPGGDIVAALVAVNAVGDVIDPGSGTILAGTRRPDGSGFADSMQLLMSGEARSLVPRGSTVIGVVATTARLDKAGATALARMAHDGLARTIRPSHTSHDGDTLFALSLPNDGARPGDLAVLGPVAAEVVARAIVRSVEQATGLAGIPAKRELRFG